VELILRQQTLYKIHPRINTMSPNTSLTCVNNLPESIDS